MNEPPTDHTEQHEHGRAFLAAFGIPTDHVLLDTAVAELQEDEGRIAIQVEFHIPLATLTDEQARTAREVYGEFEWSTT